MLIGEKINLLTYIIEKRIEYLNLIPKNNIPTAHLVVVRRLKPVYEVREELTNLLKKYQLNQLDDEKLKMKLLELEKVMFTSL